MSTINMIKTIKMVHPSCIIMVKIGNFYHVYGKDAYIFSYLLEYKLTLKEEIPHCGFPINSISKVENVLEKNKINYISVERRNNYDVEDKYIDKQENKYDKIFEKAQSLVQVILRKDLEVKRKIKEESYDILEYVYSANVTTDMETRKKKLECVISKVKVIDFLVNLSYDKKIINQKKYLKVGQRLDDISKYVTGWIQSINK